MKRLFLLFSSIFILTITSCASITYVDKATLNSLIDSQDFTFMAKRANPTNYDVVNVMNSMPGGASSRMLDLDYGYTIKLSKDELNVELPYFGRSYNPSYDPSKNGFRFTSKDFGVVKSVNKKGNTTFEITPKDIEEPLTIYLEVFKTGSAFVSINSSNRQAISYDGYLMKPEDSTK